MKKSRQSHDPAATTARLDTAGSGEIPSHVAIIMDGNHRWAKERHLPGAAGHRAGAKRLREIAEAGVDMGIRTLTLFAFSTENWQRPSGEVSVLMDLMRHVMGNDLAELHRRNVRLRVIGERARFADDIQRKMEECEALTRDNDALNLVVCVNFGGRWDIVQATRRIAVQIAAGRLQPDQIDENLFGQVMSMGELPDPDLLIRTGGDHRVSNFLLWDLAYTELYFTDQYWPDFSRESLVDAVAEFGNRKRRFGARS